MEKATTQIYTLSLHDALPIYPQRIDRGQLGQRVVERQDVHVGRRGEREHVAVARSEEHTSELQSQSKLVCRLLLEKKKVESIARPRRNGERRRAPTASISKESPAITGVVEKIGRAVQQECRDRSRMPSSA